MGTLYCTNGPRYDSVGSLLDVAEGCDLRKQVLHVSPNSGMRVGRNEGYVILGVDTGELGRQLLDDASADAGVSHSNVWKRSAIEAYVHDGKTYQR